MLYNGHIWNNIEPYFKQIFKILLSYQGEQAQQVGTVIANIVNKLKHKY